MYSYTVVARMRLLCTVGLTELVGAASVARSPRGLARRLLYIQAGARDERRSDAHRWLGLSHAGRGGSRCGARQGKETGDHEDRRDGEASPDHPTRPWAASDARSRCEGRAAVRCEPVCGRRPEQASAECGVSLDGAGRGLLAEEPKGPASHLCAHLAAPYGACR